MEVPVDGTPSGALGLEITFSMGVSEKHASDWIYATNFGSSDNRVFLAGYSETWLKCPTEASRSVCTTSARFRATPSRRTRISTC